MEEWRAKVREQYRPSMVELVSVFDKLPRRPDEDEWRAALVEELPDLLQVGVEGDVGDDAMAIEAHLMGTLLAVHSRVKQAAKSPFWRRARSLRTASAPFIPQRVPVMSMRSLTRWRQAPSMMSVAIGQPCRRAVA